MQFFFCCLFIRAYKQTETELLRQRIAQLKPGLQEVKEPSACQEVLQFKSVVTELHNAP